MKGSECSWFEKCLPKKPDVMKRKIEEVSLSDVEIKIFI